MIGETGLTNEKTPPLE